MGVTIEKDTISNKPITRDELAQVLADFMAAKDKPNKFLALLTCRRTLSVVSLMVVVVAKHFGLQIDENELLTLAITVAGLVVSHGLRQPS